MQSQAACNLLTGVLAHRGSFNSNDNPAALLLTPEAQDSHFFNSMPANVVANLQKLPIAMENHQQGAPAWCAGHLPALPGVRRVSGASQVTMSDQQLSMPVGVLWPCTGPAQSQPSNVSNAC